MYRIDTYTSDDATQAARIAHALQQQQQQQQQHDGMEEEDDDESSSKALMSEDVSSSSLDAISPCLSFPNHKAIHLQTLYCNMKTGLARNSVRSSRGGDDDDDASEVILFDVGRTKNCTVSFSNDKNVSRKHCRVILRYRARGKSDEKLVDGDKYELYVEDLGSKYGTFLSTYDENSSAENLLSLSQATTKNSNNYSELCNPLKSEKMKRLVPNVPMRCEFLTGNNHQLRSILIQCGVTGSSIRVTRCPIVLCLTSVRSKVGSRLIERLDDEMHLAGIELSSNHKWDSERCTHLIAQQKSATAKMISAWASRKPIVSPNWVFELLDRTDPVSPFPNEMDPKFIPPSHSKGLVIDNVNQDMPRDIMCNVYLIFLQKGDVRELCRSAGAQKFIVDAFDMSDEEFYRKNWIKRVSAEARTEKIPLFFVEAQKPTVEEKRRSHFLIKEGIESHSCKEIAFSIGNLRPFLYNENNITVAKQQSLSSYQPTSDDTPNVKGLDGRSEAEFVSSTIEHDRTPVSHSSENNVNDGESFSYERHNKSLGHSRTNDGDHIQNHEDKIKPKSRSKVTGGWFNAKEHSKSKSDDLTEILVRPTHSHISKKESGITLSKRNKRHTSILDYKRFKKNKVLGTYRSSFRFTTVLPKETEAQRQMLLTQKELDRENAAADALFEDNFSSGLKSFGFSQTGVRKRGRSRRG